MSARSATVGVRDLALQRLLRVEDEGAYVARLGRGTADAATSRGAVELVAGVTRHRRWLDYLLSRYYRGDLEALDPPLRQILRMGTFDLVVRRRPPHAAVSEAVDLAGRVLHRGASGLTNGVLRALARSLDALPEPATGDVADDLGVRHSHPTAWVRRWLARWGEDATRRLLAHNNAPPKFGVRVVGGPDAVRPLLQGLTAMGVEAHASGWLDDFVTVDRLQPVVRAGWLADGRVAVQDEAAGLVTRVVAPRPGERILDAAAAPGGKSLALARQGGADVSITALDVSAAKVALIDQAASRQGVTTVGTVVADLRTWERPGPAFDAVLLDAPCSGTGVLAKRADLRWRRSPDDLAGLTALQEELLDAAARHVRPGGRFVYATCSLEPEENEERVAAFLSRHAGWTPCDVSGLVPPDVRTSLGFYQALPYIHGTDGAFAAVLQAPAADG